MYVPLVALTEVPQMRHYHKKYFLSEGCRCCFDKEVGLDRTYLTYFLFSPTIEMQQILPYHKKLPVKPKLIENITLGELVVAYGTK